VVDRLADVLVLVVEAQVDLMQPARLCSASGEIGKAVELRARRPAVAAAGELAEAIDGHLARVEAEPQPADLAGIGAGLRDRRPREREESERRSARGAARRAHFFVSFIGSHSRVSEPQKSTHSSYVASPPPTPFA